MILDDLDNIEQHGKNKTGLLLKLVELLKGVENIEDSVEFMSLDVREIFEEALIDARRRTTIRYTV